MAVVAIDWDHTLMDGEEWLPGAKDAIRLLREKGHKVCIHSCNNPAWIEKCLNNAGIVVDLVWKGKAKEISLNGQKPVADLYIDDKGYHFQGNWPTEIHNVLDRLDNRKKETT